MDIVFLKSEDCMPCKAQQAVLDRLESEGRVTVETHIADQQWVEEYDLKMVPSMIVGDTLYEGLLNYDELLEVICPS